MGQRTRRRLAERYVGLFEERTQDRWIRLTLALALAGWTIYLVEELLASDRYVDWMFISFGVVFFPVIFRSLGLESKLRQALDATIINRAIDYPLSGKQLYALLYGGFIEKSRAYTALLIAAVEVIAWLWTFVVLDVAGGSGDIIRPALLLATMIACSMIAGARIGTAIALGGLGRQLRKRKISCRVMLAHPDNAGGFGQIGDFFKQQALLLGTLTAWLSIWWLLAPGFTGQGGTAYYAYWQPSLFGMWIISVIFLIFSFVQPLMLLRRSLAQSKAEQIKLITPQFTTEFDHLDSAIKNCLASTQQHNKSKIFSLQEQLSNAQSRLEAFRGTPNTPANVQSIFHFVSVTFSIVFFPLIVEYLTNGFASVATMMTSMTTWISK